MCVCAEVLKVSDNPSQNSSDTISEDISVPIVYDSSTGVDVRRARAYIFRKELQHLILQASRDLSLYIVRLASHSMCVVEKARLQPRGQRAEEAG